MDGPAAAGAPLPVWAAKVMRDRPARRAASITLMTAWCVAIASAEMIRNGSLRVSVAARSARVSASTLRPSTAWWSTV